MRLSIKSDDPGFVSGVRNVTVYLDGVPAKGVLTADEERGFIVCHERVADGSELLKYGDLIEVRKNGVVRIDLPDNHELRARWTEREARTASAFEQLAQKWEDRARRHFKDAESEKDPMGRRAIEHGAMCYCNAARELRELLVKQEA